MTKLKKTPPKKRPPPFPGWTPYKTHWLVKGPKAACGVMHESGSGDDLPTCAICRPLAAHAIRVGLEQATKAPCIEAAP